MMDGYKYLCLDAETQLLNTEQCLVYSFGISLDWSFDWDMENLGCQVFSFDPSVDAAAEDEMNGADNKVTFFKIGLSSENITNSQGWRLLTLDSVVSMLGHTDRIIHYLKIDIDDYEWQFLQEATSHPHSTLNSRVLQMALELHFYNHVPVQEHVHFYRQVYRSLLALQQGGFVLFSYDPNPFSSRWLHVAGVRERVPAAVEVVWFKSNCLLTSQKLPAKSRL